MSKNANKMSDENIKITIKDILDESMDVTVSTGNIKAIMSYFNNRIGIESLLKSFGVDFKDLTVESLIGLLNILTTANRQWDDALFDKDPTYEQTLKLHLILLDTAILIIRYLNAHHT